MVWSSVAESSVLPQTAPKTRFPCTLRELAARSADVSSIILEATFVSKTSLFLLY